MRNNFESSPANTTNENSTKTPEASGEGGEVLAYLKKMGSVAHEGYNKAKERIEQLAKDTIAKLKGSKENEKPADGETTYVKSETGKKVVAGVLTVATVAAFYAITHNPFKKAEKPIKEKFKTESVGEIKALTGYEEYDKLIDGSFIQYGNPGCHDDKDGIYSDSSMANTGAALELIGANQETATPEEWGAAYQYVTYSQAETAAYVATAFNMDGFEDLSYEDACDKIKNMNKDEKGEFQDQLKGLFDNMEFGLSETSGTVENFYIIDHDNGEKEGVVRETKEDRTRVLTMTVENTDGEWTKTVAEAMTRCFNGSLLVTIHHKDGTSSTYLIKVKTPDPDPNKPKDPDPSNPEDKAKDSDNMLRIEINAEDDAAKDVNSKGLDQYHSKDVITDNNITSKPVIGETTTTYVATTPEGEEIEIELEDNKLDENRGRKNEPSPGAVEDNPDAQAAKDEGMSQADQQILSELMDSLNSQKGNG